MYHFPYFQTTFDHLKQKTNKKLMKVDFSDIGVQLAWCVEVPLTATHL